LEWQGRLQKRQGDNEWQNEQRGGSGNFANDPKRASEAGKKGRQQQQSGGSRVSKEA
jgi:general stress protein YciG